MPPWLIAAGAGAAAGLAALAAVGPAAVRSLAVALLCGGVVGAVLATVRWVRGLRVQVRDLDARVVLLRDEQRTAQRALVGEVHAATTIDRLLEPEIALPPLTDWAVPPTLAAELLALLGTRRPALVVELGSGSSTVVLAEYVRRFGLSTRIVSLDHDATWAGRTRAELRRRGLEDRAEIRHAPLADLELDGCTYRWYARAAMTDLHDIDLLVVDGPPEGTNDRARLPAGPVLIPRVSPGGAVLLDDAQRPDEAAAVAHWCATLGVRPVEVGSPAARFVVLERDAPEAPDATDNPGVGVRTGRTAGVR